MSRERRRATGEGSGLCRATGLSRCQVPSGILYCLLAEPSLPPLEGLPAWRVAEVFPQVPEQIPLEDPPLAFTWYLRALGLQPEVRAAEVRGTGRGGTASPPRSTSSAGCVGFGRR